MANTQSAHMTLPGCIARLGLCSLTRKWRWRAEACCYRLAHDRLEVICDSIGIRRGDAALLIRNTSHDKRRLAGLREIAGVRTKEDSGKLLLSELRESSTKL